MLQAGDVKELEEALEEKFGFREFRPGQLEVIGHLMANRSAAAVFATGAGKSLCYQLPATLLPGLTVVVSPLIALMKDQISALEARGIEAYKLDSTLSFDEYKTVMDRVRSGRARMLYVAPERFNNERFRQSLDGIRISLFAIDEAHCISEWGHNFRPDYLKLARFAEELGAERILALTATATDSVLADICESLAIDRECAIRTPFYRANLTLETSSVSAGERDALLVARLGERPRGSSIVYVTLQRTAEVVAKMLARAGFEARPYHAGMENEARAATQEWFTESSSGIVVATIAFGMGIDKADIRYVYHYNLPKSLENYSQEIGRAGRDGAESICEVLACPDDLVVLENFVYGDTPTRDAIGGMLDHLFSQGESFDIAVTSLARQFDMRPLVMRTLLTYLELRGFIEGGTPFYSVYELKPLMSSAQMLATIEEGERSFVRSVLSHLKKARTWFRIDVAEASRALGVDRRRVVAVLDRLDERKMLELRSKGVRHRYKLLTPSVDVSALADELHRQATDRESKEIGRLRQVTSLVAQEGCQVSALGAHFSEQLAAGCGHCSFCKTGAATQMGNEHGQPLDDEVWRQAAALRRENDAVLGEPRAMAQFLCGIRSPALSKAKLNKHELFGSQAQVAFASVLHAARTS